MAKAKSKKPAPKPVKKPAAKRPAKPKPEPKVHAALVNQEGLRTAVPHGEIKPSALNPRKSFDPDVVAGIGESILQKGLLQPLTVRRAKAGYEIVIGETRWRAIAGLIKAKKLPAGYAVPVTVLDLSDREVVEIALIENKQRQDLTPLEEARGYARLRELGDSTDVIAEHTGISKRTVQSRLHVVDRCAPAVIAALESGAISITQARTLAMVSHKRQREILADLENSREPVTEEELLGLVTGDMPGTHLAIFPLDRYTGEIVTEDGTENTYFADEAQYLKLQEEAIAEKKAEIEAKGKKAVIIRADKHEWFHAYDWERKPKAENAVTVIEVGRDLAVTVHTGMVKKSFGQDFEEDAPRAGAQSDLEQTIARVNEDDAAQGTDTFTKAHRAHANRRKTYALQAVIAQQPVTAMRLFCARMLDQYAFGCVLLRRDDNRAAVPAYQIADQVRARLTAALAMMPDDVRNMFSPDMDARVSAATSRSIGHFHGCDEDADKIGVEIWATLCVMTDAEVSTLFAALVAAQCGIWGDGLGCTDVEVSIAESLGIAGCEIEHGLALGAAPHGPADLDGLRKNALIGVRRALGAEESGKDGAATIRDAIMGQGRSHYVLPTFKFLAPAKTAAEIVALVAPAASKAEAA